MTDKLSEKVDDALKAAAELLTPLVDGKTVSGVFVCLAVPMPDGTMKGGVISTGVDKAGQAVAHEYARRFSLGERPAVSAEHFTFLPAKN